MSILKKYCYICKNLTTSSKRLYFKSFEKRICSRRSLSTPANLAKSSLNHVYQSIIPWTSQSEFVEYLQENVIYEDGSIIVINKPHGIPMKPLSYEKSETKSSPLKGPDLAIFSITSKLAKQKGIDEFFETYSQARLHSGLVVLAKSFEVKQNLRHYFRNSRSQNLFNDTYRVVTCGSPEGTVDEIEQFPIERVQVSGNLQSIKPKLENLSEQKRQRNRQAIPHIKHRIINENESLDVAYVELQSSITKWDILQLYMLHTKSPILGDPVYSSRLKLLNGIKMIDKPKPSDDSYKLSSDVMNSLDVSSIDMTLVPLHVHCHSLNIPRITKNNKRREILTLTAPLPTHFEYSLECLKLKH